MHHQAVLAHKLHDLWMKNYGSFDESMMGKRLAEIQARYVRARLHAMLPLDRGQKNSQPHVQHPT